jgi:segregation and condensation protein A
MTVTEYRVKLEVFEGPLDLLLHLIEKEELDITKVSLALVADQYLAYIAALREITAANLADFIVVAARLIVIKSRALLPQPEEEDEASEDEEDIGEELARQLREYKRYRQVAQQLKEWETTGHRAYARIAPPPKLEPHLKPGDVTIDDLARAFREALEAHPAAAPVDKVVSPLVVHITDCMERIAQTVDRYPRVRLSTLIRRARSRIEVVVYFLAVLEMIKQQRVRATQERPFAEIHLEKREPDPDADIAPTDLREYGEPSEDVSN